ncbi:MAG: 3-dehydroquinate synthase, partial [Planctomycetes bacterium]|nr:3-dehydroquinate synthase [Planctomycetota bacterium]
MKCYRTELGDRSYDILIGPGLIEDLGQKIKATLSPSKVCIITDANVGAHYGKKVRDSLKAAGYEADIITVPPGEDSKSISRLTLIYDELLTRKLDRKSCIIALGGGVVGDLAGFAAATYMRGIPFVQVPTSMLAMVDSSNGGKTGINHPLGKNMIGSFHQPSMVVIDTDTLKTLPKAELLSGLAEVIKHGMIRDREYLELVDGNAQSILDLESGIIESVIHGSCVIKGTVVTEDEREGGIRALLNFGHTFGHAI